MMLVKIDKKTEATIAQMVHDGDVRDASEAVEIAVSRLAEMNRRRAELEAALKIGIDQLDRGERVEVGPDFVKSVMARARAKVAAGEQPNPDVLP